MNTNIFKTSLITSLKVFCVFTLLLGLVYPLFVTGVAQLFMKEKANGSIVVINGEAAGSKLIGQKFTSDKYFHSRPSASDYREGKAENLALSSDAFLEITKTRAELVRSGNNIPKEKKLPADMVLSSASGLDPHITLENAMLQVPRVAKARKIPAEKLKALIESNIDRDFIGIWGQDAVNVLMLNIELERLANERV